MALAALIVAVVAAVVSLLSFGWTIGWSVWQHRQLTRPAVKLQASFAFLPDLPNVRAISLTATNVGQVPITIRGARFSVDGVDKHLPVITWITQTPNPLPLVLGPGESWMGIVDADYVRAGIAEMGGSETRAAVRDAADNEYRSELLRF